MKPTILHTEESNGWGGQEIRIVNEMLGMTGRGYNVILATPRHAAIYARARAAGIRTFAVDMDKSSFIPGMFKLVRIIRQTGASIINTHSSRDSWMGSIAGRLAGVRVLRTRHISSALRRDPLTKLVYGSLADGIITTGEFIKGQLTRELGIDPARIFSIPTGIDIEKFGSARGAAVRRSLGISDGETVLGCAAALRSWKGHEYLIKAMPEILKEYPGVKLVLAGDGPVRPYIERWVDEMGLAGAVFLLGQRDDVHEVIGAFDVSLLASYASEGVPQFVLQSMAAGKPVVGTRVGGIPEAVVEGVTGLLVPPRDPAALAAAVKSLLRDPGTARLMGEAGRKIASEKYSLDVMLDRLEELYGRVLAGRYA